MKYLAVSAASILFFNGCVSAPLAPTECAARAARLELGQTRAQVEAIMVRKGPTFRYHLRSDQIVQTWPYQEHFKDMCLVVTYDQTEKVIDVAMMERDRGRFARPMPGNCV